jgi:PTS system mannose-specific IIB component
MTVVLARVDNRLIHGQVLEGWIPKLKASTVVVVDDSVADDSLQQAIMEIAIPPRIQCKFIRVRDLKGYFDHPAHAGEKNTERVMILFSEIRDALEVMLQGVRLLSLNIGNVHYEHGKRRITSSVSLNDQEISWLDEIESRHCGIDIRATPDDPMMSLSELLDIAGELAAYVESPSKWWDRWPINHAMTWFQRNFRPAAGGPACRQAGLLGHKVKSPCHGEATKSHNLKK